MDDESFPSHGPGVSPNGNFVLTELKVSITQANGKATPVRLRNASADFSQESFSVSGAIDGKNDTGWAVMPAFGKTHTAVFETSPPVKASDPTTLTVVLEFQSVYPQHQIGKLRLSVTSDPSPSGNNLSPELRDCAGPKCRQPNRSAKACDCRLLPDRCPLSANTS